MGRIRWATSSMEKVYHRVSNRDSCKAELFYCMLPQLCPSIRSSQEFMEKIVTLWELPVSEFGTLYVSMGKMPRRRA